MTDKMVNNTFSGEKSPLKPPSVDRNLKPNAFKLINPALKEQAFRCSTDLPSTDLSVETDEYTLEIQTLPRKLYSPTTKRKNQISTGTIDISVLHQRSESTNSANHQTLPNLRQSAGNEHKLQYFDLDVANPPNVNRQSISTNNFAKQESVKVDPLTLNFLKSGVVYNSVDFVKTEAFKRIREERKKESGGVNTK